MAGGEGPGVGVGGWGMAWKAGRQLESGLEGQTAAGEWPGQLDSAEGAA